MTPEIKEQIKSKVKYIAYDCIEDDTIDAVIDDIETIVDTFVSDALGLG